MDIKNRLDPFIVLPLIFLSIFGLVVLFSVVYNDNIIIFYRQLIWFFLSMFLFIGIQFIPIKVFYIGSYLLYFFSIFLLFFLKLINKAPVERWFDFGIAYIQPSEFAKVSLILALPKFLLSRKEKKDNSITLLVSYIMVLIPFFLVFVQPDLGTSILFLLILFLILFLNDTKLINLFILLTPILSIIFSFFPIIWIFYIFVISFILYFAKIDFINLLKIFFLNIIFGGIAPIVWNSLRDYQKNRFLSYLSPEKDVHGYGWNLLQSKIGIGSGGIFGKGFLNGTQKGLNFVPQQHTDFIFSAVGEEFGFVGYILILILIFIIIFRVFFNLNKIKSKYTKLVVSTFTFFIVFEYIINISMSIGLVPIVGVPLPLFSYGGSSYITTMIMFAIVNRGLNEKDKYW
ncbi:MAG: rod shape-determining protein RodA [candidate division WOR-3 bacterium]